MNADALDPRLSSTLSAAQALAAQGRSPTISLIAKRTGLGETTVWECRKKLIAAGLWKWATESRQGKKTARGPMISYSPKASRRGRPKAGAKRVGRWPRFDRERIERELAEWRLKAGPFLHPAH